MMDVDGPWTNDVSVQLSEETDVAKHAEVMTHIQVTDMIGWCVSTPMRFEVMCTILGEPFHKKGGPRLVAVHQGVMEHPKVNLVRRVFC